MSDDEKKKTAVWSKPSKQQKGLTEEQMLNVLEEALEARGDGGKSRPETVQRFSQWKSDAWSWLWWTIRNEPMVVIVWLSATLFGSTMAINHVIDEGYVDPEDFPFATQRQHSQALCEVRAGRIEVCSIRVAIGQIEGPCPKLPESCSSDIVLE